MYNYSRLYPVEFYYWGLKYHKVGISRITSISLWWKRPLPCLVLCMIYPIVNCAELLLNWKYWYNVWVKFMGSNLPSSPFCCQKIDLSNETTLWYISYKCTSTNWDYFMYRKSILYIALPTEILFLTYHTLVGIVVTYRMIVRTSSNPCFARMDIDHPKPS